MTLEAILSEVRARVIQGGRNIDQSGHAANGRALWVYLASSHESYIGGPVLTRPLLVVYETGSSRMIDQRAGEGVFA
jgi:hypothetical protein